MQQNWHHGYLQPVSWALLIHLLFFVLLLKPLPVAPPPAAEPVLSYLYTPPKPVVPVTPLVAEPQLPEQSEASIPVESSLDLVQPGAPAASAANSISEQKEVAAALPSAEPLATLTPEHTATALPKAHVATQSASASMAERALSSVARQYSIADADYSSWAQQQRQPRATVARQHQQAGKDPAQAVLFTYNDGQQLVKLDDRCLIVDPTLSGFEQLMKAKGMPCKESDDAILFRETMAKWLNR